MMVSRQRTYRVCGESRGTELPLNKLYSLLPAIEFTNSIPEKKVEQIS
jgi:hypothetical protein